MVERLRSTSARVPSLDSTKLLLQYNQLLSTNPSGLLVSPRLRSRKRRKEIRLLDELAQFCCDNNAE